MPAPDVKELISRHERMLAAQKRYRDSEKGKVTMAKWRQAYYQTERGKEIRSRSNESTKRRYTIERDLTLTFLGGKCIRCDFSDVRALQIDHVNGGGCQEMLRYGHDRIQGMPYAQRIRWFKGVREDRSGKYQLLCANCNWIKRAENNEYRSSNRHAG